MYASGGGLVVATLVLQLRRYAYLPRLEKQYSSSTS